jgi:hypothetical protein
MNDKIKNFLIYTGIIGSAISAVAYLIVTYVIVVGFESAVDQEKQILFATLGALVGLIITSALRSQGITFASKEEESMEVMKEYYELINRKKTIKQLHTIKYFVIVSTIKDVITKGITIGVSTWFIMYIFMEGNGDFSLFALTVSNIFMFAGFGLVALSKSYDKYNNEHIPVIKSIIERLKTDELASIQAKEQNNANIQQCELFINASTSREEPNGLAGHQYIFGSVWSEGVLNL